MRKIILLFVGTSLLVAGLILAINLYANPFGYFGDKQLGLGEVFNARIAKLKHLKTLPRLPEAIVLGSSNSMRMKPETIRKLSGLSAYNYGVFYASVEDFYCISRSLKKELNHVPKLIILCLDDWNLAKVPAPKDEVFDGAQKRLAYKPVISQHLDDFSRIKLTWARIKSALAWEMLAASFRAVLSEGFERTEQPHSQVCYEDGTRKEYRSQKGENITDLAESGKFDVEKDLKDHFNTIATFPDFKGVGFQEIFEEFSEKRLALLDRFFAETNEQGTKIIINIMPVQPYFQQLIRKETNYDQRMKELVEYLLLRKQKYPNIILVQDNHLIENFKGSETHFFDYFHPTSVNSDSMLHHLFKEIGPNAF